MKKYRPSNSTEGMIFCSQFCDHCLYDHPIPDEHPICDILTMTYFLDESDPEYPSEWTYDEDGNPTCTKYKFHDWDDGPPKPPKYPDNPNQLLMFGYGPQLGEDNKEETEPGKTIDQPTPTTEQ